MKGIIREKRSTATANSVLITTGIVLVMSIIVAIMLFKRQPHLQDLGILLLCNLVIAIVSCHGFSLKYFRKFKKYQPTDEEFIHKTKEKLMYLRSSLSFVLERRKNCEILLESFNRQEKKEREQNWFSKLLLGEEPTLEFAQEKLKEYREKEKWLLEQKIPLDNLLKELEREKIN